MTTKHILWIKVPSDLHQDQLVHLQSVLETAFKGTDYGFFIVPDKFDILSIEEVEEFLVQALRSLRED